MKQIGNFLIRDTLDELVDPAISALVIVDLQNDFCHPDGVYAQSGKDISTTREMLPRAISFVAQAQKLGVCCVFVRQVTLENGKGDTPAWLHFKIRDGKPAEYALRSSWGSQLIEGLQPATRDLIVEKLRPDAFHHTPLDALLRANRIESLLVLGTLTEGCVESTIRSASYHDFYTVVVENCLASPNRLNHEGSLNLFRARYPLATTEEILRVWHEHGKT